MMKALMLAAGALVAIASTAHAAPKTVYIAPDDHTDYMWAGTEAQYRSYFPRALDAYLDQMDATAGAPSDQQARWNAEGSIWVWTYERDRSAAQFDRLIGRIRDGHLNMAMNTLVSVHGGTPLEGILRDLYYAGRLERRYGLKFPIAIPMENQTASFGLASVYAGAGALYSWKGVCGGPEGAYCTNVQAPCDRPVDAFWAGGADGSRLLTKWMSYQPKLPSAADQNQGPGGYAEARYAREAVPFVSTDAGFAARWPYDTIGLFGAGWDDLEYIVPLSDSRSFPGIARDLSDASRRVVVSNEIDFFQEFAGKYGASLPTQAVSFGNEWDLCTAQYADKSARVRRAIEKLRAAEAMTTIAALANPAFTDGRATARDEAFHSMALFFEHNVCGGGPAATPADRVAFQERQAGIIESYVDTLHADAASALATLIPAQAGATRLFAFNPLGWVRTDVAEAAAPGTAPVRVIEVATGKDVVAETIGTGAGRVVRWLATSVPSVGYKVYELRDGAPAGNPPATGTFAGGVFSTARYRLKLGGNGAITSLIDRANGNRELVRVTDGRALNDFGAGSGTATLERIGPVSATIRADVGGALPRTVRVTLYRSLPRVDIEDRIGAGFDAVQTYGFSFNLNTPSVRHEEVGAVIKAKLETDGGQYSARTQNSLYEWLTLGHFAAMTEGDGGYGVMLSNADAYFMRLGNSTLHSLDTTTPRIDVLAGGRAVGDNIGQVRDQGGDTRFLNRFALVPTKAYSQLAAMKMAMEHQNPIVTGTVTGTATRLPATTWGLLRLSSANQLVWAVKPAEEGIGAGVIVRAWNQSAAPATFTAALGAPYRLAATTRTTNIETNLPDQTGARTLEGNRVATYRLSLRP